MWEAQNLMGNGQEPIPFLRSGKTNFSLEKFNNFWNDSISIGHYILELIKYYIEIEKAKKHNGVSIENTLGTLYFLILSGCYDSNDQEFQNFIEEGRQRWEHHRMNHESLNPLIEEIIAAVLNIPTNPDDLIPLVISHTLKFPCKPEKFTETTYTNYYGQSFKIITSQDIQFYQSKGFMYLSSNPKFCIYDKGEFIGGYGYLTNHLKSLGYLPLNILELFHRKIQEIIIDLRAGDVKLAQSCLLPLLHVIENLLIKYPIVSYDSMDALIIDLDIIRRWPLPYGSAANKLLELVLSELKSPSSAITYIIREEFPIIDIHIPIFDSNPAEEFFRSAGYIILDSSESLESSYFYRIGAFHKKFYKNKINQMVDKIDSDSSINLSSVEAHITRCLIILFIFSLYVEINTAELSHIAGLSTENVYGLYKRVIQMIEKISTEEMDRARTLQEWFVLELFEEVKTLKSNRTNPLTEPLFVYLSEFEIYFPSVPSHSITVVDLTHIEANIDTVEDIDIVVNHSVHNFDDPLIDILRQNLRQKSLGRPFPVKIILTGSDVITHRLLRNYVKAVGNGAELDTRFYVVPTFQVSNTLAMYLASIDSWYTRHVYIPFYYRPWVPRLDTKVDLKHASKKDSNINDHLIKALALDPPHLNGLNEKSLPIAYCDVLLESYLLEARHLIPIKIYKIKFYRTETNKPDEIIPMALYMDIGASSAAKRLQELNPSLQDKSFAEVAEHKSFRFRSLTLQMQMSQMDLLGKACGSEETVIKNVYNLTLGNVPREQDKGMSPIPQMEWLELSFIEREAAEQEFALLKGIKNKKIKEPQSFINVTINSLYSNLHISSGKIMAADATEMDVVVDGVLYGPFKQVFIEPWILDTGDQLVLPVYTYLDSEA